MPVDCVEDREVWVDELVVVCVRVDDVVVVADVDAVVEDTVLVSVAVVLVFVWVIVVVLEVVIVECVLVELTVLRVDDIVVHVPVMVDVGHDAHITGHVARANPPNMLSCTQR